MAPLMRTLRWLAVALAVVAGSAGAQVVVEGARYDSSIVLGGQPLLLNGVGVRKRLVFDIYVGGLYVSKRAARTEELVSQPGPKRVALRFLRDVEGELFVNSLHVGLKANHTEAELARWQKQLDTLTTTIKTIALARRGDTVYLGPALVSDEATIDRIVAAVAQAVHTVLPA